MLTLQWFSKVGSPAGVVSYSLPPNPATHRPEPVLCMLVTVHCSQLGTNQIRSSFFNQALACSSPCPSVHALALARLAVHALALARIASALRIAVHALALARIASALVSTSVQYARGGCRPVCGKFGSQWWCQLVGFCCTTQSIETETARSGPPDANAAVGARLFKSSIGSQSFKNTIF